MDNAELNPLFEEVSIDILKYAALKLPDADPVALSEVIAYTVHKCRELGDKILEQKSRELM